MGTVAYFISLSIAALLSVLLAAKAEDDVFAIHAWICVLACLIAIIWRARTMKFGTQDADEPEKYLDGVVRAGTIATVFWGLAGFLVGVVIATQLAFPALNLDLPWTSFGRLRPLHTSAVVFAFGGNALICTSFYVVQRTCGARLALGNAAWFVFWGYQLFIVLAATGYLLGAT
ncbi:MAG: cbb3-type cytochrome c oxidase subunit I, partial [Hyphomicrobiales bacterium]